MPTQKLSKEIIAAAIDGFLAQQARLDAQIAELRAMLNEDGAVPAAREAVASKRRKLSAATRQRMKEGQQRRWAKIRGESSEPATPEAPKTKRKLSSAGRAAIVAALKKRWAAKKAEAAKAKPAAAKKGLKKAVSKKGLSVVASEAAV